MFLQELHEETLRIPTADHIFHFTQENSRHNNLSHQYLSLTHLHCNTDAS